VYHAGPPISSLLRLQTGLETPMDAKDAKNEPKPVFLGPEFASAFQDASVVQAYPYRPAYPESLFHLLVGLIAGKRRVVLDVGAGTGDIARRLAPLVERVDAVDWSEAMIAQGKQLPGGDSPRLRWIAGRAEEASLDPPYGLVTCGESLHWMDWDVVMPRLHEVLVPGGFVAIMERDELRVDWSDELLVPIRRYSTNRHYQRVNLIDELARRDLFTKAGGWRSEPETVPQSIDEYIESMHSRSSFSRERMPAGDVDAFDATLRALLERHAAHGQVELRLCASAVWGAPQAG
jgi:ubiquinone/menaquinone biosynthesis C-methylase UbiE